MHSVGTPQNTSSPFGAFLDPVADKLMVATVLVHVSTRPIGGGAWAGNAWLLPSLTTGATPPLLLLCEMHHTYVQVWVQH